VQVSTHTPRSSSGESIDSFRFQSQESGESSAPPPLPNLIAIYVLFSEVHSRPKSLCEVQKLGN